jgi:hypothetical protein
MRYEVWRKECGVWSMAYGVWCIECGVWRMAYGVWRMVYADSAWCKSMACICFKDGHGAP